MSVGMTTAQAAQQNNRDCDGRYAEKAQPDPGADVLTTQQVGVRRLFANMVDRGVLSPAARDMDPREALEQHAEASAMNLHEKQELFSQAGLELQMTAGELAEGDLVDMEPIIREFGDSDIDEADLLVAACEMATVEQVEDDLMGGFIVYTDQGTWGVPADRQLDMILGDGRCEKCGRIVPDDEGVCADCN